ncbi:hypothetical protein [Cupriavidus basilensis]|uniref:hypothetical protein n=1 Tax=Cupriavidus basilensis TaxID=68895 RepID=UPI00157B8EDE|nr:hypothetical protein [Cupriavidus basilensis]NUA30535.1 hypothetical protein [Cupriavidus basilensis]
MEIMLAGTPNVVSNCFKCAVRCALTRESMTDTKRGGLIQRDVKLLLVFISPGRVDHPFRQFANFRSRQAIRAWLEIAVEGNVEAARQGRLGKDCNRCSNGAEVLRQ